MTQIRTLYVEEPEFPATAQHPNAERFAITAGNYRFADCVGGEPTQAELDAVIGVDAAGIAAALRKAADATEDEQAKADAQIQSDLNMTPQNVSDTVDTIFAGWTAPQRTFMKRLVRMVLAAARKVLR